MWQDGEADYIIRAQAENIILTRYNNEIDAEIAKLRKESEMRKVAAQLHDLAPNKTIGIIKTMRLIYGLGLKEAKKIVDDTAPLPF